MQVLKPHSQGVQVHMGQELIRVLSCHAAYLSLSQVLVTTRREIDSAALQRKNMVDHLFRRIWRAVLRQGGEGLALPDTQPFQPVPQPGLLSLPSGEACQVHVFFVHQLISIPPCPGWSFMS